MKLKLERIRLNKSLIAMAEQMTYTPAYISKVERGVHAPTTDFLAEYARALGTSVSKLVIDLRSGERSGHKA